MAADRQSMRQMREILCQEWALGLSHRALALSLGISGPISSVVTWAKGPPGRTVFRSSRSVTTSWKAGS